MHYLNSLIKQNKKETRKREISANIRTHTHTHRLILEILCESVCVCARRHLIPTTKLHVFIVVAVESAAAAQRSSSSSGSRRGFCASYAIQRVNKTGSPTFCGKRVRINPAPRLRTPFPHKHHHPPPSLYIPHPSYPPRIVVLHSSISATFPFCVCVRRNFWALPNANSDVDCAKCNDKKGKISKF